MSNKLNSELLNSLFFQARTHNAWQERAISREQIETLYDCLRWGPTSMNTSPARFLFVQSGQAKKRLEPHLSKGNVEKTMSAPLTVIIATDPAFFDHMDLLAPHNKNARDQFADNSALAEETAMRNGTLQGGYLILAARALGLDCGPMSGFDKAGVDGEFFSDSGWRSNFLCNIGYGDPNGLRPRGARLDFDQACEVL